MNNELVSIIMPVYNEEKYLRSSILSVLNQTYENWELLIVDDCSTDASPGIVNEYVERDHRIKMFKNANRTYKIPAKPRNVGIKNAHGRYITFLDSDDQWLPTKLEHQLQLFKQDEDAVIVYSNYKRMDAQGHISSHIVKAPQSTTYKKLLKGNVMGCLTVMYDVSKVGKQYCPLCGYDDYALWLQILRKGGKAYNTNTPEALYRDKGESVSSDKIRAMKWNWHIYRRFEKLKRLPAYYYFANYAVSAVIKRIRRM